MERHSNIRGVVVQAQQSGEKNSRVGLYTENGLLYATAYGGRSLRSLIRGSDMIFSMGRFFLERSRSGLHKIYDVKIYDTCYTLSRSLICYYAACVCAEVVRFVHGAEHRAQFKLLVDTLLELSQAADSDESDERALVLLCIFLWRTLRHNGWNPDVSAMKKHTAVERWHLNMDDGVVVPAPPCIFSDKQTPGTPAPSGVSVALGVEFPRGFVHSAHLSALTDTEYHAIAQAVTDCRTMLQSAGNTAQYALANAVVHLIDVWHHMLERSIRSAQLLYSCL